MAPPRPHAGILDPLTRVDNLLMTTNELLMQQNNLLLSLLSKELPPREAEKVIERTQKIIERVPVQPATPIQIPQVVLKGLPWRMQEARIATLHELLEVLAFAGIAHRKFVGVTFTVGGGTTPATVANRQLVEIFTKGSKGRVAVLDRMAPWSSEAGVIQMNVFWDPNASSGADLPSDTDPTTADLIGYYITPASVWHFTYLNMGVLPSTSKVRPYLKKSIGLTFENGSTNDVLVDVIFSLYTMSESDWESYVEGWYAEQMKWLREEKEV